VAEVVSPGDENHKRDYKAKRKQYQERGIPEYWLLNPETETIEVLELKDGQYVEFGRFQGTASIQSPSFNTLPFTAQQVFSVGR
jgi:Uma2 family endonuclease